MQSDVLVQTCVSQTTESSRRCAKESVSVIADIL